MVFLEVLKKLMFSFPVVVSLFGSDIFLHTLLESVGIFVGMRFYYYLKRKSNEKVPLTVSLAVLLGATLGALIGSKLIGNLEDPLPLLNGEVPFDIFWHSNTIVGGLAFGLLGVELAKKTVHYKHSTGDLMVYPLITAMIIGRIGCFSMGVYEETYGIATHSIFGMNLGDGLFRHPVSLYEIAFLLFLAIFLLFVWKSNYYYSGLLFQLFMLSYFSFRFLLDFIKPRIVLFSDLGTIQMVCLFVIIYYLYLIKKEYFFNVKRVVAK